MNEVQEICIAMLDEPEPPMRAGEEALGVAKRATRRRTAGRLLGAGTGAAGLAGLVAAALIAPGLHAAATRPGPSDPQADPAAPAQQVPNMVAAAQTTLPDLPSADQAAAHGDQIYRILLNAVPAGYQAERGAGDGTSLWLLHLGNPHGGAAPNASGTVDPEAAPYVATADLLLKADGREGGLAASVWGDHRPAPTGDLCSAEVNARMDPIFGAAESCQVIVVGGLPMRVTTHHDPEELEVVNATWFVHNGFVTVTSQQGVPKYQPDTQLPSDAPPVGGRLPQYLPPLQRPALTPQQVATIAANPDLLP